MAELVFPATCAACERPGPRSLCADCAAELSRPPAPTRPQAPPDGLPPCAALGDYGGALRELVLAYKERGRRDLARPLGEALAAVVLQAAAGVLAQGALILVPVPATAAAVRQRHGDHLLRLARPAARFLRAGGRPAVVAPVLRARPRPDSAGLDAATRARLAGGAFVVRPHRVAAVRRLVAAGGQVVLLDDVVTTGSTLAAVAGQLGAAGVPVTGAAVLAATRLRRAPRAIAR